MTEFLHKQNGFGFSIEEFQTRSGEQAFRIRVEVLEPFGYFHCGYKNLSDAEFVLSNLVDGSFTLDNYRSNIHPSNPHRVRENLKED